MLCYMYSPLLPSTYLYAVTAYLIHLNQLLPISVAGPVIFIAVLSKTYSTSKGYDIICSIYQ